MIYLYSGTPGSGKSLQGAQTISRWLKTYKSNVLANTEIKVDKILKGKPGGNYTFITNEELTTDYLYKYALKNHDFTDTNKIEHQTLLYIDECQIKYHPTVIKLESQLNPTYRKDWIHFFTHHRHLGYDVILITQFDKLLDPQIRCLLEYNYVHRKANNFGFLGALLTVLKMSMFVQVQKWYGVNEVTGKKFFFYKKKWAEIYDSYAYRKTIMDFLAKKYGEKVMHEIMGIRYVKN